MRTAKEKIAKLVEQQPNDGTFEEIIRELVFGLMIERGIKDSDKDHVISNKELSRRIKQW